MTKRLLASMLLVVFFASATRAQTVCGISHTDVRTGEVVCDDYPSAPATSTDGISHTDEPQPGESVMTAIQVAVAVVASVVGN